MSKYSRAFRAFKKIKTLKPSRSVFDLSHSDIFTGDMGKLYPICALEMSPGDTFHIWNEIVTRMQPLNAPILHDVNVTTHWFFCPFRILWEEWTNFISGTVEGDEGGSEIGEIPATSPQLPRWNPTKTDVGSLWDYMGLPTGVVPAGALPVDFLRRVYNRVWNEFYRDENLQDPIAETNEDILYRNWAKDYFTSGLLSQQRGVSPSLPVNGFGFSKTIESDRHLRGTGSGTQSFTKTYTMPLVPNADLSFYNRVSPAYYSGSGGSWSNPSVVVNSVTFNASDVSVDVTISYTGNGTGNLDIYLKLDYVEMSDAQAVDVKDLRVAFQIQRWLELANRGGVRYTEFLRSFFGVSPRDDRLQRPEYIGGTKSPVIISEVLQTSATASEPTPQGNMAGHGLGADRTFVGSYTAVEYGICIGLLSVMPSAKYQQGINKQWLRRSKYDYLFPQFTGLSEQAIEEAEIYAQDTEAKNRRVFGYNEIYDELRCMPSRICGKMRSTFDYWHLGRKFDSAPSLNSDFIKCNPSKRIFAAPSEDGFIFSVGNIIRAVRPLPKYGTPR